MDPRLYELVEKARQVKMTEAEWETQRLNFAYGNTHFENHDITRDTVRRASERLNQGNAQGQ